MKKYILFVLFAFVFTLVLPTKISAFDYNGGGEPTTSSGTKVCQDDWKGFCPSKILKHTTIRATIAYVDAGEIVKNYGSVYYTKAEKNEGLEVIKNILERDFKTGYNLVEKNFGTEKNFNNYSSDYGWYSYDSEAIEDYFDREFYTFFKKATSNDSIKNEEILTKWMQEQCDIIGKKDYKACHSGEGAERGFRVLIEPVYLTLAPKVLGINESDYVKNASGGYDKQYYLKTTKEISSYYSGWTNSGRGVLYSIHLHTDREDVGISPITESQISELKAACVKFDSDTCINKYRSIKLAISSFKNGYGLNIISWPIESIDCFCIEGTNQCSIPGCGCDDCSPKSCECEINDDEEIICPCDDDCDKTPCLKTISECNYKIKTNIPTSCDEETSGYVKDIDNWACIFKSTDASNDASVRGHYKKTGVTNSYCSVYCREEVNWNLPENDVFVSQGKYMVVALEGYEEDSFYIGPITYIGTQTCRVTSKATGQIDIESFKQELSAANRLVNSAWNEYQYARALYLAYEEAEKNPGEDEIDTKACRVAWEPTFTEQEYCRTDIASKKTIYNNQIASLPATATDEIESYENLIEDLDDINCANTCVYGCSYCSDYPTKNYYNSTTFSDGDYEATSTGAYQHQIKNNRTQFSELKEYANQSYNDKKRIYNEIYQARETIINQFKNCTTTIPKNVSYSFKPQLNLTYEENIYGGNWELLAEKVSENREVYYYNEGHSNDNETYSSSTSYSTESFKYIKCGTAGKECVSEDREYAYSTWWESTKTITYTYKLPSDTYQYVEKGSGQSVSETIADRTYYDIGFGNLPIHYSTPPDEYYFEVQTTGFNNKFDQYIFKNGIFNRTSYSIRTSKYNYGCTYNVRCTDVIMSTSCENYDQLCPDSDGNIVCTGLNLVYRTISLNSKKQAFPGIDGEGREPGANWNNDTLISAYITNNRNVSGYEVYHLDPLYEIELTPALMKKFREYNKKMNGITVSMYLGTAAEKEGIAGYSDFSNMNCTNGQKCTSTLLRGLVYDYSDITVTGCAISKGKSGYTKCSRAEAW